MLHANQQAQYVAPFTKHYATAACWRYEASLDVLHCRCNVLSHCCACIQLGLLLKVANPAAI
jgi:hypothetical protein